MTEESHVALALGAEFVIMGRSSGPEFRSTARLILVSDQSFRESHANVTLRDAP